MYVLRREEGMARVGSGEDGVVEDEDDGRRRRRRWPELGWQYKEKKIERKKTESGI